jgi:hypothetical protein
MVLSLLAHELVASEEFWAHVDQVRGGHDPERVAKGYGSAKRSHTIACLLSLAASGGASDAAYASMLERLGADRELAPNERKGLQAAAAHAHRERAAQRLMRRAVHYPLEPQTARGTYRYRPDFLQVVRVGAMLIARRGGRSCLLCGSRLARGTRGTSRSVRRDYCFVHEPRTEQERNADDWRQHAIATVFEYAREAVLRGLPSI